MRSGAPPDNTLSWLRTVVRHEACQVRDERERQLGREDHDVEQQRGEVVDDPAERVERFERLAHTAEALRGLKPQEVTALVLRAEGLTYKEICERTSWTYTRCNRAVTEGRRALRRRLNAIESGAECERWVPLLSLLADGEATARELAELRPHLRSCPSCRATLRGFHAAPRQVGALVPVGLLPVAAAAPAGGGRHVEAFVHWMLERAGVSAMRMQGAVEALSGAKVAAVAASTVAVAGSGAAIERAATAEKERPPRQPAAQVATTGSASGSALARPLTLAPAASRPLVQPTPAVRRATAHAGQTAAPGASPSGAALRAPDSEFALEPTAGGTGPARPERERGGRRKPADDPVAATPPPAAAPADPPPTAGTATSGTASAPPSTPSQPSPSQDNQPPSSEPEFGGF